MKLSIIMTVFDRHPLVLANTFRAISKNDLDDTEVIVIDDGSTVDYGPLIETLSSFPLRWLRHSTLEKRPTTYNIDGHNNPAYVNNVAIDQAEGDIILFLSSDTLIPPHALATVKGHDFSRGVVVARTIDLDTAQLFCGVEKIWPMCWFIAAPREQVVSCGKFDEKYLDGMAFEDNDFTARLVQENGSALITSRITCWHQSHPQVAYSDEWGGFKRSEAYTKEKWGGVPWRPNDKCFEYEVIPREQATVEVIAKSKPKLVSLGQADDVRSGAPLLG